MNGLSSALAIMDASISARNSQREADAALVEGEAGEVAMIVARCARRGDPPSQLVSEILAHLAAKIRGGA